MKICRNLGRSNCSLNSPEAVCHGRGTGLDPEYMAIKCCRSQNGCLRCFSWVALGIFTSLKYDLTIFKTIQASK